MTGIGYRILKTRLMQWWYRSPHLRSHRLPALPRLFLSVERQRPLATHRDMPMIYDGESGNELLTAAQSPALPHARQLVAGETTATHLIDTDESGKR
jgi:hypothetical protein